MKWDQQIFVAEFNVQHFRQKLAGDLDAAHRQLITALLAEEEVTLARLRATAAEQDLCQLMELMAQRATKLVDREVREREATSLRSRFTAVLQRIPCGVGLIDSAGKMLLANVEMLRFVPREIPSRDPERMRRWRFDAEHGSLNPFLWPGARALRGERVSPGLVATYTADDGHQQAVQVAAVPVKTGVTEVAGAMVAVYDMEQLGGDGVRAQMALVLSEEMGQPTERGASRTGAD